MTRAAAVVLAALTCEPAIPTAPAVEKTVVLSLAGDAGANSFVSFGPGSTQAVRLADGADTTGIRSARANRHAQFRIDPSDVPRDVGRVVQLTLLIRERFGFTETNGCGYACYMDGGMIQSILVFNCAGDMADRRRDLLVTGEEVIEPERLATLEVSMFNKGWVDGDRWEIAECSVLLTYVPTPPQFAAPRAP